ncbi:MAG TPA: 4-hydroxy-tetrahydrodipicolinate reductase [Acidimicrobiales bacterium]
MRVAVFGAGGRMGATVCRAITDDPDLELVAAVDPSYEGLDVRQVTGVDTPGLRVGGSGDALLDARAEVAVDFTRVEGARENAAWCAANGVHAVIGTSGFEQRDFDDMRKRFTKSNCLVAPNFAIGAVLMMRFAELAAPWFDTAEIIEFHHESKIDAPSGTAVSTAERMAAASTEWLDDPTQKVVYDGARGGSGPAGIRVHAVRMRGAVASQEVILGTTGQTLTVRHDTVDRSSFMPGVVLACKRIAEHEGVTVGLDAFLGLT